MQAAQTTPARLDPASVASAVVSDAARERAEAEQTYHRLIIAPELSQDEAAKLRSAIRTLNLTTEQVSEHLKAVARGRQIHQHLQLATGDEAIQAQEAARKAREEHGAETERLAKEREAQLQRLLADEHRAGALVASAHRYRGELEALENRHAFITGMRRQPRAAAQDANWNEFQPQSFNG